MKLQLEWARAMPLRDARRDEIAMHYAANYLH